MSINKELIINKDKHYTIYKFTSSKFPKLEVMLADAPENPFQLIAFDYLECIEDRKYNCPKDIPQDEAIKIAQWALKGGHTPALESINLIFLIRGMSKVVSHQIVRHRIGVSIGQRTQRANGEEYLGRFATSNHYVLPPSINNLDDTNVIMADILSYLADAQWLYNQLINLGISQDEARYIIPQCAETSMTFKVIFKSFMHIASVRLCHLMQGEMVEIVRMMAEAVNSYCPELGEYLKPTCLITGICNRNENNPNDDNPKGVCNLTINGDVPKRKRDDTFDLTKYSKDADK